MRNLALTVAAILVLATVSPVFAQPFADVPTDHWAFDAIAELAAKGIIEGFPDGTFKGDRGVTRYELAMVVARILARIEAIKIPPPPPPPPPPPAPPQPEVTRADIQAIQRLVNEFRAELAALGVRVTAVEEELAALKGALDKTTITGDWTYVNTFATGTLGTVARNRARLTFKGSVGAGTAVFVRARWNAVSPATYTTDFDRVFFDWSSPWGISFRVGRDYWSFANGILLSSAENSGARNGVRASGSLAGFSWTVLGYNRVADYAPTPDLEGNAVTYAARVSTTLAGWSFGLNYRNDRDYFGNAVLLTTGWSVDFSGDLFPGFSLSGEYASVSSPATATAWTA
ncbi:MAG: S-layer homology domain-containing protein, partial [Armatimonadota bacterium]|nr:S-layer homology domain-containing protein [Armatimonadota bacterium]